MIRTGPVESARLERARAIGGRLRAGLLDLHEQPTTQAAPAAAAPRRGAGRKGDGARRSKKATRERAMKRLLRCSQRHHTPSPGPCTSEPRLNLPFSDEIRNPEICSWT